MNTFNDLGLSEEILKTIDERGFEEPTPIQQKVIPAILAGSNDIVGQALTGTGKTAAFALPIIDLLQEKKKHPQVLVLTPTRELAVQVAEEFNSLKGQKRLSIIPIYGGQSIERQLQSLARGIDIIVGTPGRILDHIRRKTMRLDRISYLVLDEADEMLNMGFLEEVSAILEKTPSDKRTMLFSATIAAEVLNIAEKYMNEYELIKTGKGQLTVSETDQIYFEVKRYDKFEALCRIIDMEEDIYALVFCRTKVDVDTVANHLMERGYDADGLHGDMTQFIREKILAKFKSRRINILVATDVAARGIDIQDLTHVINYSLPQDPEAYIHRIGRTGRAGKTGIAVTFITPTEYRKLQFIQKVAKSKITKATLPKVSDVLQSKRAKIHTELNSILSSKPEKEYIEMAHKLLHDSEPTDIVAGLLKHSFHMELDSSRYSEIAESGVDNTGTTRLFVTQGRKDGLTPRKLIRYVTEKTGVKGDKIKDLQILDSFSFLAMPFIDAENVLAAFKGQKKGRGLIITKAKDKRK